jgi:hypothetical protein
MAKKPYAEKLDDSIFDALLKIREHVLSTYPEDTLLDSMVRQSFVAMQPQEQMEIVQNLGPDWMVKVAAKIEKKLGEIDKQGVN